VGSPPTASRASRSRSTSRIRASSGSSAPTCWKWKGHARLVHAHPAARGGARDRQRLQASPAPPAPAGVRSFVQGVSRVLRSEAVQQELRAASRQLVRAEPSRRGLCRDLRRVDEPGIGTGGPRYEGWPALKKLEYMDALMKDLADRTMLVRTHRRVDPLPSIRKTLRAHYGAQAPPLRPAPSGLLRPRPAAPVLGSSEDATNMKAARFIARARRTSAAWSPAGPANISTRSIRSSRR